VPSNQKGAGCERAEFAVSQGLGKPPRRPGLPQWIKQTLYQSFRQTMYQGTDRSTEPDQWRSRPLEQQMFERVDGEQLMVKRSQLGKPPRQIK